MLNFVTKKSFFLSIVSATLCGLSWASLSNVSRAANVTMDGTDNAGQTSFNTGLNWDDNTAPSGGNDYFSSNFVLRTPSSGSATFQGNSLSLDSGGTFAFKTTGVITVNNLIMNGGQISQFSVGGAELAQLSGNMNVAADSVLRATGTGTRRLRINSTITGSANLEVATDAGGDRVEFNGDMSGYSGDITVNGRMDTLQGTLGSGTVFVNGEYITSANPSINGLIAGTMAGDIVINDGGNTFFAISTGIGSGPYVITQQFTIDGDAANSSLNSQLQYDPAGPTMGGDRDIYFTNIRLAANAVLGVNNDEGAAGRLGLTLLGDATLTSDGAAGNHNLIGVASSGGARTLAIGQTETFNTQLLGTSDANTTLALQNANLTMDPVGTGADINGSINVNSGSSWTVSSDWVFDGDTANVNSGGTMTGESVTVDGATFDVSGGLANIQSFNLINGAQGGVSNGGTLNILGNTTTVNGGSTLFITGSSNLNEAMDLEVADGAAETGFVDQNTGGNARVDNSTIIGRNGGNGDWTAAAGSGTITLGTGEASDVLHIGHRNNGAGGATVGDADFSGAASVTIDVNEILLGTATGNGGSTQGILTLSNGTNTVTAETVILGDSPNNGNTGVTSEIILGGAANNFAVNQFTIADRKSLGTVSIVAGGSFDLIGTGGTGTGELDIGLRNTNTGANVVGTLDLADAASVNINLETIRLGTITSAGSGSANGDSQGIWNFSNTLNDVTADTIVVGFSPGNGNTDATSTITLGSGANNVNVGTFTIGGRKSQGEVTINAGGTLTLRGQAGGTSRADVNLGANDTNTGTTATGTLNLSGGTVDAMIDSLVIGQRSNGSSAGSGVGVMTIGTSAASVLNINSIQLGKLDGSGNGSAMGTLNVQGGSTTVNNTFEVGRGSGGSGIVNQSGGTVLVTPDLVVGALGGVGQYNLSGGNLDFNDTSASTQQTTGLPTSTLFVNNSSAFNFSGGTLENVTFIEVDSSIGQFTVGDNVGNDARFVIGNDGVSDIANAERAYTTISDGQPQTPSSTAIDFQLNSDGTLAFDVFGPGSHGINGEQGGSLAIDPLSPALDSDILHVTGDSFLTGFLDIEDNGFELAPFHWYDVLLSDGLIDTDGLAFSDDSDATLFRVVNNPFGAGQLLQVAVPEPASLLLWAMLGVIGFLAYRRTRR